MVLETLYIYLKEKGFNVTKTQPLPSMMQLQVVCNEKAVLLVTKDARGIIKTQAAKYLWEDEEKERDRARAAIQQFKKKVGQ